LNVGRKDDRRMPNGEANWLDNIKSELRVLFLLSQVSKPLCYCFLVSALITYLLIISTLNQEWHCCFFLHPDVILLQPKVNNHMLYL